MKTISQAISVINHASQRGSIRAVALYSKQTLQICKFLYKYGYLSGYNVLVKRNKKGERRMYVEIYLTYYRNRPVLGRIFRISHMGHHRYFTCRELRQKIAQDRILYIVSTNKGWMTINDCIKRGIGGELLFGVFS
ncbi:MAG TPA: 30S ribosomal protein S8 [Bacteroidia bacterium]|jgi:ribosomal protein S8